MRERRSAPFSVYLAEKRQEILTQSLIGDHKAAQKTFENLLQHSETIQLSEGDRIETQCRLLETEMDLAQYKEEPTVSLAKVMLKITVSSAFAHERKLEILERGLLMISREDTA